MFEELTQLINSIPVEPELDIKHIDVTPERFNEIKKGFKKLNSKYLNRFGSPGHYIYVYMPTGIQRMNRRVRFLFARMMKKSNKFMNQMRMRYEATSFTLKPKTWHSGVIKMSTANNQMFFHVNLKSHQIYSYRSKRGQSSGFTKMNTARKAGLLRYR